jgi:REP element-mobilizing transposase RayT
MITRRCTQRQFLMRPDPETNNTFIYCLAVAAQRANVEVIFTAAQSNHHHTGIYDPKGTYPEFIEHFHKLFAKSMNCLRGRWENFWSSEQTSVLRLVDRDDVLDKMVYALTNPVKDNLVATVKEWPGANSYDAMVTGRALTAHRPAHFFRDDGPMPETVTLAIGRPVHFADMDAEDYRALLTSRIQAAEAAAADKRCANGVGVLGRQRIVDQDWRDNPTSHEPRRNLSPRIAAKNKWRRIEALLRNRLFQDSYVQAFNALKSGVKDVLFPAGTYWLRRFAAAACDPWPTGAQGAA